jgi:hypothetical protein
MLALTNLPSFHHISISKLPLAINLCMPVFHAVGNEQQLDLSSWLCTFGDAGGGSKISINLKRRMSIE